jgi:very-short-patch-repair endonuclease
MPRYVWLRLRGAIPGYRFRRQAPLGPYVVDFACLKARLVIEVDGGQPTNPLPDPSPQGEGIIR